MQHLKKDTNKLIHKTERDSHTQKTNLWLPKDREIRTLRLADTHRVLYINRQKIGKQQGPTVWHSNCMQHLVKRYNGKESEKNITESLCSTLETNTTL